MAELKCLHIHMRIHTYIVCILSFCRQEFGSIFLKCSRVNCTLAGDDIANYNKNILDSELYDYFIEHFIKTICGCNKVVTMILSKYKIQL